MKKNAITTAIGLVSGVIAIPAIAQVTEDNPEAQSRAVEEIIVTATRRETNLFETPMSITAITAESLSVNNINDVSELQTVVPGLQIRSNGADGQGSLDINLRGIGNSNFIETGESNVSFNIDGVYTARPQAMLQTFNDVKQVEVSRGPQGTLSGRNSTAGSINVITNKPDVDGFEASVQLEAGIESARGANAVFNVPVSDQFALRANFASFERDSLFDLVRDDDPQTAILPTTFIDATQGNYFETNFGDPEDDSPGSFGSKDSHAWRIAALWQPSDSFDWLLSYDRFQNDALGNPLTIDCNRADCESHFTSTQAAIADENTSFISFRGELDQTIENFRSVINLSTPFFDVKYTYGRSEMDHAMVQDTDAGVAIEIGFVDSPWLNESDVHDLQFSSNGEGNLNWVTGFFSFQEKTDRQLAVSFFPFGFGLFDNPNYEVDTNAVYADAVYTLTDNLEVYGGLRYTRDRKKNQNEIQYGLTSGDCFNAVANSPLNVMPGDARGFLHGGVDALRQSECVVADNTRPKVKDSFVDFRVGARYNITEDLNTYFTISSGHKAKLQDQRLLVERFDPERVNIPVDTEEVLNWEWGLKGSALDGRVNFASAIFYLDFKNKQEAQFYNFGDRDCDLNNDGVLDTSPGSAETALGCGTAAGETFNILNPIDLDDTQFSDQVEYAVVNADGLDIYGFEFEGSMGIGTNGYLSTFLTYTKAEYGDFFYSHVIGCPNNNLPWCAPHNVKGNQPRNTPAWTFNLSYTHYFTFSNGSVFKPSVNMYYRDKYYLTPENVDGIDPSLVNQTALFRDGVPAVNNNESEIYSDKQDSSVKVNVNLAWTSPEEKYTVELFGTNIFDEKVASHARIDTGNTPLFVYEDPAYFGLRVGVNLK